MSEKRTAGILGNRATIRLLTEKFADKDGIVRCCSCGATPIEWHHVVWLELGGKDVISNINPVCPTCHRSIHYGYDIRLKRLEKMRTNVKKAGRHRNVPDNYKDLLNDYVNCRIGRKTLAEKWGLTTVKRDGSGDETEINFQKLTDYVWYREYLAELGLAKVINRVDNPTRENRKLGTLGYLVYETGQRVDIYAKKP